MKMLKLVMNMALVAMFVQLATATDYTVGSPAGSWDQFTDLQTWAASKNFLVGDSLVFQYSAMHTVLEVSKTDYESCTTSSPIMTDTSGNTRVPLRAAGKRYFICGIPGHCQTGMKMEVDTNPPNPPPTKASPPPPSFSTPSKPPPSPSNPPPTPSNPPPSPSNPPPSFVPRPPSFKAPAPPPKSPFVPPSKKPVSPPPTSSTPSKSPPSSSMAPQSPTNASTPYGGPTSPVGSPALATNSSSTMQGGFKPMLPIAIAMVLIAIH